MPDRQFDTVFFHELTHAYGVRDDSDWGEFYNAHVIERLLYPGLIKSGVYSWMKRYAQLKLNHDPRVNIYVPAYHTGPTRPERIDFLIRLWEFLP